MAMHRERAGFRVGDDRSVDLYRYVGWARTNWRAYIQASATGGPAGAGANDVLQAGQDSYSTFKDDMAARSRKRSLLGRDIGELPPVQDPPRRERARRDFRFFCETYFPHTFHLAWSRDHLKILAKVGQSVLEGGLFACAAPRGTGKSVVAETGGIWAVLYGHRNFVALIGATEALARDMLASIKTELESNPLLHADFPEVTHPIRELEGIANRCSGQLYKGERTHIGWTDVEVVLPSIAGSPSSGAIIKVAGITGTIRGVKHKRRDGKTARPSLVIVDDPQTDESARSLAQCAHRERILSGAILGLAGPGVKISGIMPCTVIRAGDMADNILDREKHPEWNGERAKLIYKFPTNEKLWARYAEIRADSLRQIGDISLATAFYQANQTAMDDGADIAWPERFDPDEISGVQHAMDLKLQDEGAFWAEHQNEPIPDRGAEDDGVLDVDDIMRRCNGRKRGEVAVGATHLTMFIDVHANALFYLVAGWHDDFTGYVVDYGTYPDQKDPYFALRDARITLQSVAQGAQMEGAIYAGLEYLTREKLTREWRREDGANMRIERCMIDANWSTMTDVVYEFCRASQFAPILIPSHGRGVTAKNKPFKEYQNRPGDQVGLNWRIPNAGGKRAIRHMLFDTNYWKSFVQNRLAGARGDHGSLTLFGRDPERHRLLAEHLTAEFRVRTEGRGRTVDDWSMRPGVADNHWLDCLVGAAVAASVHGAILPSTMPARQKSGTGVPLSKRAYTPYKPGGAKKMEDS